MEIYYSDEKKNIQECIVKEKGQTKELLKHFKKEFTAGGIKYKIFVVLSCLLCILIFSFFLIFIAYIFKDAFSGLKIELKKIKLDKKLCGLLLCLFMVRFAWIQVVLGWRDNCEKYK